MGHHIYSDCDSEFFGFNNLVHVLEDFYNLRHDNNFLNDLLEDVGHLDEFLLSGMNWDWSLFETFDDLEDLFDVVDISDNFFVFLDEY